MKIILYAVLAASLGCGNAKGTSGFADSGTIRLEPVGAGFKRPVYVTSPSGDARLFVVEQAGIIRRFRVTANPDVADLSSAQTVLSFHKPGWQHNGGLLLFGPDGMLYAGTGDGGLAVRLAPNAQDPKSLLGKMLRVDVDAGAPYAIPPGNERPWGMAGRPEIWAMGLRNPWRFAFDSAAGLIYIADVGQFRREEVNVVRTNRTGVNFGWNVMEGRACYWSFEGHNNLSRIYWNLPGIERLLLCRHRGLELPVVSYAHSPTDCAIIGGFAYRGRRIPALGGRYIFSDFCGRWVRSFRYSNGIAGERQERRIREIGQVVSFGEDGFGEMYIVGDNGVFQLTGLGE